jgi:hypothetical protein
VEIVGTSVGDLNRSCDEHDVCGATLTPDAVVSIRRTVLAMEACNADEKKTETVLACFLVKDGLDCCMVGFLPERYNKEGDLYDGSLAQVTEVFAQSEQPWKRRMSRKHKGCCEGVILGRSDRSRDNCRRGRGTVSGLEKIRR